MSLGLSVGRPIFLFPNTITSLFGAANIIAYRRRKVKGLFGVLQFFVPAPVRLLLLPQDAVKVPAGLLGFSQRFFPAKNLTSARLCDIVKTPREEVLFLYLFLREAGKRDFSNFFRKTGGADK